MINVINEKNIKQNLLSFYISLFFITIAVSLPHSVLTILLLNKGLCLSQIMLIQVGYSLAIILIEYPSGILADIYSRKLIFILSKLFLIMLFIIVFLSNNFILLFIAWFLYGISSALENGTIEVQIINDLKVIKNEKIKTFIKKSNILNFIALILGSTLGSYLYFKIGISIYLISILLTTFSVIIIAIIYRNTKTKREISKISFKPLKKQVYSSLYELKNNYNLRCILMFTAASQIFFQTHFQLWQAFFLTIGINKESFFIFYIIFQLIGIISYIIPINYKYLSKKIFIVIFFLISIIPIFLMVNKNTISLITYILCILFYTILSFIYTLKFTEEVSTTNISSLTSLKSTTNRFIAIITLLFSSLLLNFISAKYVVTINFIIASLFSGLTFIKFIKKHN